MTLRMVVFSEDESNSSSADVLQDDEPFCMVRVNYTSPYSPLHRLDGYPFTINASSMLKHGQIHLDENNYILDDDTDKECDGDNANLWSTSEEDGESDQERT